MGFNTFPCNPYPISTAELNKGNNDDLNARVDALESDVSDLDEQKANQITIALPFNPETTYEVGDLVYHNGLSYRCTNEHTGEWDADDFAETTIANELSELKSGLTNKAHIPSTSGSSLGTIAAGNSSNFTVNDNGYLAIVCATGSSQNTFSAIIRDSSVIYYGTIVNATLAAYSFEAIGGLFVKNGRTYSVKNNGENDIEVYFCT